MVRWPDFVQYCNHAHDAFILTTGGTLRARNCGSKNAACVYKL